MSSRGHSVIIIRAFSQATTSNAELLNRAHINILFLLLFIFHREYWSLEIIYLLQIWSISAWYLRHNHQKKEKRKRRDWLAFNGIGSRHAQPLSTSAWNRPEWTIQPMDRWTKIVTISNIINIHSFFIHL